MEKGIVATDVCVMGNCNADVETHGRASLPTNENNETNETNEINTTNEINETNETNATNGINGTMPTIF